ncbi:MAG: hypothetical protein LBJ81_00225 [Puniceicoccales bacterium]|nr:hypothetical protein [Puniceicoccales bacterium]
MKYWLIIFGIVLHPLCLGRSIRTRMNAKTPQITSSSSSDNPQIPTATVRPYAYSGVLKRREPSLWQWPFFQPNYEYHITDKKGKAIIFLDLSTLATGTSLANLLGKMVTVNGPSSPHRYRGAMVVKAQNIVASGATGGNF